MTCITVLAPANGQFTLKTDSTVGLDEQTRAMISNFPKDVREQTYLLLGQALPLLKTNIDAYLKEVNNSVEMQILNVQCAATGLAAEFKEQFKGIFTNPRGPIAQFRIDEAKALSALKHSTPPDRYADAYGDLYHESAVMFCQMHISGASENAIALEDQYRRLDFMWMRLKGHCSDADDCLEKVREDTKKLLDSSDARDVQLVKATERLTNVPNPYPGFFNYWFSSFDQKPYESSLTQLFDIQTAVTVARTRREYMAAEQMDAVQKDIADIDAIIGTAQRTLQPRRMFPCSHYVGQDMVNVAVAQVATSDAEFSSIDRELAKATELDTVNQVVNVNKIKADLASRHTAVDAIKTTKPYQTGPDPGCSIKM
jgi:hypothetical protein